MASVVVVASFSATSPCHVNSQLRAEKSLDESSSVRKTSIFTSAFVMRMLDQCPRRAVADDTTLNARSCNRRMAWPETGRGSGRV
ncbi:hypothetical protein BaRGS_00024369 [Batillaria attramentaria]|uniref:Secreted protein n=1 Tax=Batillaria attramentaria TaxID=370345 RepID=A0ABD0KBA5_9CAEN